MIMGRLRSMASVFLCSGDRILLLYRQGSRVANNQWIGSAGGHFEPGELTDARACVLRELREETGLDPSALTDLRLRYITLRNVNGEVRINYYFFAGIDGEPALISDEGTLKWFDLADVPTEAMPFSARFMMEHYRATGRFTDNLYGGISNGETVIFTEMPPA